MRMLGKVQKRETAVILKVINIIFYEERKLLTPLRQESATYHSTASSTPLVHASMQEKKTKKTYIA